jgi:hypothetical protein
MEPAGSRVRRVCMPWMLLSNHRHVLLYVDTYPDARLREIAAAIGITERAAHKIVTRA